MKNAVRVLWLSESPLLATGFGRATREITRRLAQCAGIELACCGWSYDGFPYESHQFPLRIYPAASGSFGQDTFERAVNHFRPHVVISLAEIWMVQWLASHPTRGQFKWLAYFPIDSGPLYPPWEGMLMSVDEIVVVSQFGVEVLKAGIPSNEPGQAI